MEPRRIGIIRVHLEEDAGKSMHDEKAGKADSRIDLNRAGTPLLEIVSQPDMRSPAEAKATEMVTRAIEAGDVQAINYFVAQRYTQALEKLASAPNQKVLMMPLDASSVLGSLAGIAEIARREFNDRLKAAKVTTGRWHTGTNLVDRLLGKELCVLAWAAEPANDDEVARLQRETSEARRFLEMKPSFTLGAARDIRENVHRAALGGTLDPLELLDVLTQGDEPWTRRLSDAAEMITWRAVNAG